MSQPIAGNRLPARRALVELNAQEQRPTAVFAVDTDVFRPAESHKVGCWYVVGSSGGSMSCLPDSQYQVAP